MYVRRAKFKARNALFLLGSILLHLILLLLLNISDLGPDKKKESEFELNSIKVANLTAASKPKPTAKASTSSKKSTRKRRKAAKTKTAKTKAAKTKILKKTNLAKATHSRSENIPKQIKSKTIKRVTIKEKIVRRQEYKLERNPIRRKQIIKKLNVPQVQTFKTTTSTLERVTKVKTVTAMKTPQIQRKIWQQNITKKVEKQSKAVKPTAQRMVVTTKQLEYKPRQEKPMPKIEEKRVTYEKQTKKLTRKQINTPQQLEVAEMPKQVTEQVTQVRQVIKKATVVGKKTRHKIKKYEMAEKRVEKQSKAVKPTVQRMVVTTKQLEYKPRQEKPMPKIEKKRVTYEKQTEKLNRKQVNIPQQLKVAEVPEQVVEQVTHFRQVTKQTTVVTKVVPVPVIKNTMALEQVPMMAGVVKGNQQITPTTPREVALKQLKYEERVASVKTFEDVPRKAAYQQAVTEQNVKAITGAPDIPFEEAPTQPEGTQVSMTKVAKQETAAYDTVPTTMPQLPTAAAAVEHRENVEKTAAYNSSELPTKTMTQVKMNVERTENTKGQLVAFKEMQSGVSKSIRSDSLSPLRELPTGSGSDASEVKIEANLPSGNITNRQLYRLIGSVGSDVATVFVTINDITQLVTVIDGTFIAEVALSKGVNNLKVMAFNGKGRIGNKTFQLIFNPPRGGIPTIYLESPENGRQGVKFGEPVLVEGTIDDLNIIKATLLINQTPIPLKVKNGHFRKEVTLPKGKIFVFRVMAKNKNGTRGFSPAHTVLSTHDIDILNPRPY